MSSPFILAIDTSCDDTSAAVTSGQVVLSNVVASQTQLHKEFGGVFPTVAKQAHKENIDPVIRAALKRAQVSLKDISAIAVTQGPGLAPALEVGIEKAKQLCRENDLSLIAVNHIEAHALSALAQPNTNSETTLLAHPNINQLEFPLLSIVVSGGHTEFILIKDIGVYERVGFTVDDAAGEALDKFGRMVDFGYPAGAVIEQFAKKGDHKKYTFPLPMTTSGNANMSFSGLKTSARNMTEELRGQGPLSPQVIFDLCASFQYAVFRSITYKLNKLLQHTTLFGVLLGGGVAANNTLRTTLRQTLKPYKLKLYTPYTKKLCIDNAAMIGLVGGLKFDRGQFVTHIDNVERIPRWRVDALS